MFRKIDDRFAIASQIQPADVSGLVDAGYKGIICARPDNEDAGQPSFAEIAAAASKAGIVAFTRNSALELAPYRITVNAIAPGLTDTAQPRYGMTEAELSRLRGSVGQRGENAARIRAELQQSMMDHCGVERDEAFAVAKDLAYNLVKAAYRL